MSHTSRGQLPPGQDEHLYTWRGASRQVPFYKIIYPGDEVLLDPLHQWLPASTTIACIFLTAQTLHLLYRCPLAGFPLSLGFMFTSYHHFPRLSALQCLQGSTNLPPSLSFHHPSCHLQLHWRISALLRSLMSQPLPIWRACTPT